MGFSEQNEQNEVPVQVFNNFENIANEFRIPIITVHYSPKGYKDAWVARLLDCERETKYFALE